MSLSYGNHTRNVIAGLTRNPLRLAKFRGSRVKPGMTAYLILMTLGLPSAPTKLICEF